MFRKNFEKSGLAENELPRPCLSQLITAAVAVGVGEADIRVELDVPESLTFPVDPAGVSLLVQSLVSSAVACLDSDGEITVTAWQAGELLEIEIADNGPAIQTRPRFIPHVAAALGCQLVWQNCPQGGAAVTVVVPRLVAKRSAA